MSKGVQEEWIYTRVFQVQESRRRQFLQSLLGPQFSEDSFDNHLVNGIKFDDLIAWLSGSEMAVGFYWVDYLFSCGMIGPRVCYNGASIIAMEKTVQRTIDRIQFKPATEYRINANIYIVTSGGEFVVESPEGGSKVILYDLNCFKLLKFFMKPVLPEDVLKQSFWPDNDISYKVIEMLVSAGIIEEVTGVSRSDQWEIHDLFFHQLTRMDRIDKNYGGTYRLQFQQAPEPARKNIVWPVFKKLGIPPVEIFKENLFLSVLAKRKSVRGYNKTSITLNQLEALLFSTCRVNDHFRPDKHHAYETTDRPYPNAGASYELELYLVVNRCEGLEKGFYYYDPFTNALCSVVSDETIHKRMGNSAAMAMGHEFIPDVLLVISARFLRVMWKYETISYSLILKDVGVLIQTISLAATALDLSVCPIGRGNTIDFEMATGIDPFIEGSVGEIAIGGKD